MLCQLPSPGTTADKEDPAVAGPPKLCSCLAVAPGQGEDRLIAAVTSARPERRILWVGRQEHELAPIVAPLESYPVVWRWTGGCSQALALLPQWPSHLLVLDTPDGPTLPLTWDSLLGRELPAVDPYRPGGAWYRTDDTPRVLPVLRLTADIPGPGDVPPAWHYRVHCLPRFQITAFLQNWLERPLDPPGADPMPLLIVDFQRRALWIHGAPLHLPARTLEVLAVLAAHHPRPLMATAIAQHMQRRASWHTSENGVRAAVQALRTRLRRLGPEHNLLVNHGEGYALNLGPYTGSLEDRIWFWADADAWWSPRTYR